ncbi:MAG TPA: branched-chain amino acid ABC transporter permease [Bacilli bacterium]|nr:branched-chain amino acid ABC transporter permease [Bacilli bacterium]
MSLFTILQTLVSSIMQASVLSLSAFAIMLIFKTSNTTNFAQGMISALGAFVAAVFFSDLSQNLFLSIGLGIVSAFIFGMLIDVLIIRNSKNINAVGKQMITMGIALLLIGLIPLTLQKTTPTLSPIVPGNISFQLFGEGLVITKHTLITFIVSTTIIIGLFVALKYTKWGLSVRSVAGNETVAGMMGVNTRWVTAFTWAIAGGLGALAASLYGPVVGMSTNVGFMTPIQIQGFMAAILGGFSLFYGPVVGALLLVFIGNLFGLGGEAMSLYKDLIVYSLILVIIFVKPLGLFGKKVIKKV